MISHPSLESATREDLVSHVDIVATIYEILEREGYDISKLPANLPGRGLLNGPTPDSRIVFAEYGPPAPHINALLNRTDRNVDPKTLDTLSRGIQAAVTGEFKLLRYSDGETKLYTRADETADISADNPKIADELLTAMNAELGKMKNIDLSQMDAYVESDVKDRLKTLGYL